MKRLSVIIPSYNSGATIERTLSALLEPEQMRYIREVIVVDSSDDDALIRRLYTYTERGVLYLRLAEKTIPAVARNLGAERATGSVLVFIDSDAFPEPGWAAKIDGRVEAGVKIGGGSVALPDEQRRSMLAVAQYLLQFNETIDAGAPREKPFLPAVNFFCEKRLFDEIGGFPAVRASEDVLFGLQASRRESILFDPAIRVRHIFRTSIRAYLKNQAMLGRYIILYRREHYQHFFYKGLIPVLLLPAFLLIKTARIVGRILVSGRPVEWARLAYSLPLFVPGLLAWGAGFFRGCFQRTMA